MSERNYVLDFLINVMTLLCVGCAVASASAKEEEPGVRGTRVGRQECGEGEAGGGEQGEGGGVEDGEKCQRRKAGGESTQGEELIVS